MRAIERGVAAYYSQAFAAHGDSPRGADWKDRDGQVLRFKRLRANLPDLNGRTVLDVGCGTGGFYEFLVAAGDAGVRYLGIDLVPEVVEAARAKFEGRAEFRTAAIADVAQRCDF